MDEPCSALDPVATLAIEELIAELKSRYTIVIVTHNMQQAARASDITAFFNLEETGKPGRLVEIGADREDLHHARRRRRPRTTSAGGSADGPRHRLALPGGARASSRSSALGGLDLVIAPLDRTLEAVEHQDVELAELVIADDDRIDGRYLEVHQAILTLLATQAPVATDLRLIAALLHVHASRSSGWATSA